MNSSAHVGAFARFCGRISRVGAFARAAHLAAVCRSMQSLTVPFSRQQTNVAFESLDCQVLSPAHHPALQFRGVRMEMLRSVML